MQAHHFRPGSPHRPGVDVHVIERWVVVSMVGIVVMVIRTGYADDRARPYLCNETLSAMSIIPLSTTELKKSHLKLM